MDGVVTRLHHCLVEAIRERGPGAEDRPVTVAEIYQDLVPYRNVRSRLGVEMNADYEHALVRLLAGEHDLLRLEPPNARQELREELASSNPNLGLYRKFAACDVWVDLGAAGSLDAPGGANGAAEAEPTARTAARVEVETASEPRPRAAATPIRSAVSAPPPRPAATRAPKAAPAPSTASAHCAFCSGSLPAGRQVRYCPHCGEDQQKRPCPSCGEVLERGWRFCIACGTEMSAE